MSASGKVEVADRFGVTAAELALVRRAAAAARAFAGQEHLVVSVLLTDDAEIAALHDVHFGDPSPTDVISFDADADGRAELVVSVECAQTRAQELGHARADEVALYVVHGVLHACGFDDLEPHARARMRDAERAVLAALGVHVARVD